MANPVIDPVTSIQVAKIGAPFVFQPNATNLDRPGWIHKSSGLLSADEVFLCGVRGLFYGGIEYPVNTILYPLSLAETARLGGYAGGASSGWFDPYSPGVYTAYAAGKPLRITATRTNAGTDLPAIKLGGETDTNIVNGGTNPTTFPPGKLIGWGLDAWEIRGLPAGLTFHRVTGRISGTPTESGVFIIAMTARNLDGQSATVTFPLGVIVETSAATAGSAVALGLNWEMETGVVTGPGETGYRGPIRDGEVVEGDPPKIAEFTITDRAAMPVGVGITQKGTPTPFPFITLKLLLSSDATGLPVSPTTGSFLVAGSGERTRYEILVDATATAMQPFTSEGESAENVGLYVIGELEGTYLYDSGASVLTKTIRSRRFWVRVEGSLAKS